MAVFAVSIALTAVEGGRLFGDVLSIPNCQIKHKEFLTRKS